MHSVIKQIQEVVVGEWNDRKIGWKRYRVPQYVRLRTKLSSNVCFAPGLSGNQYQDYEADLSSFINMEVDT